MSAWINPEIKVSSARRSSSAGEHYSETVYKTKKIISTADYRVMIEPIAKKSTRITPIPNF